MMRSFLHRLKQGEIGKGGWKELTYQEKEKYTCFTKKKGMAWR